MEYQKYLDAKNCTVPNDIAVSLLHEGSNTPTSFENINDVLSNDLLKRDAGFARMANGDYLVSMYCPMPGLTKEMVDWWFWWHPQDKLRYQLWYPGEHYGNGYARKDHDYFNSPMMPPFRPNTQYPVERIGKMKMPLSIDFITPEAFGFDSEIMRKNDVATIICGHVGAYKGLLQHTEMAHIFFQQKDGLFLASRFWLGKRLKKPLMRKILLTDETARGMAMHCCIEYHNFSNKIPGLYKEYCTVTVDAV